MIVPDSMHVEVAAEQFGVRVSVSGCSMTFTTLATPDQARALAVLLTDASYQAEDAQRRAIDDQETDPSCVCPRFVVQHQHRHLAWCPLA